MLTLYPRYITLEEINCSLDKTGIAEGPVRLSWPVLSKVWTFWSSLIFLGHLKVICGDSFSFCWCFDCVWMTTTCVSMCGSLIASRLNYSTYAHQRHFPIRIITRESKREKSLTLSKQHLSIVEVGLSCTICLGHCAAVLARARSVPFSPLDVCASMKQDTDTWRETNICFRYTYSPMIYASARRTTPYSVLTIPYSPSLTISQHDAILTVFKSQHLSPPSDTII
jgi:hypothetical protein